MTKNRIIIFVSAIIVAIMLLSGVGYAIIKSQLHAFTDTSFTEDDTRRYIPELYLGNGVMNAANLTTLFDSVLGGQKPKDYIGGTKDATQIRGEVGKSVVVRLGGLDWLVTYISRDKSDNVIATLYLADIKQSAIPTANRTSTFGNSSSYYGINSTSQGVPTNMYGTSYIRAVSLNNGGRYVNITSNSSNPAYLDQLATQAPDHIYARYTMPNATSFAGLSNFITTPANMSWQENGQDSRGQFNFAFKLSNENWTDTKTGVTSDTGFYNSGYNYAGKYYATSSTDSTAVGQKLYGNGTWKNDKLWLPSIYETGWEDNSTYNYAGLWQLSTTERSFQTAYAWLRSAVSVDTCYSYGLVWNGTDYYGPHVNYIFSLRPALHLNLTSAALAAGAEITLDKQGGTGGDDKITAKFGAAMPGSVRVPSRTGYAFAGYFTEVNGVGEQYYTATGKSTGKTYPSSGGPTTLYAQWSPNTYTVTLFTDYSPYGGTSTKEIDVTFWEPMPQITIRTHNGYVILGYYTEENGKGTMYYNSSGESVRNWDIAADTTLYGYVKIILYKIIFDKQGGTGGSDSTIGLYDVNMPETITPPTRAGYTFDGYYAAANGGGTKYFNADGTSASDWNIASDTTLYANWILSTFTVTLNKGAGAGGTSSVTATLGAPMPTIVPPTRTGYIFGGYYTVRNGGGTRYYTSTGASARAWDISGDTTLYAKWTAKTYTVTLNKEGGTGGTSSVTATYYASLPKITIPTRAGYTFGGYFTSTNGTGTQYYSASGDGLTWDYDNRRTLHAKWTPNNYQVVYSHSGYKNLVGDLAGGFENTGWAGTFDTKHVRTGSYALKITGTAGSPEATIPTSTTIPIDASTKSHTFYVQYWGYQEKQIGSTDIYWPIEEPRFGSTNFGSPNRWNMYSFYGTRAGNGLAGGKQLRIDFNNNGTAGEVWFDDLIFLDLTATFGVGNEPTKAWCDANITTGVTTQTFTYGQAANLAMMPTTLSGHTFAGWSKTPRTATAQPIDYTDGQSVSNLATGGTLVLYAVWQKKPLGHISANSGGVVRMENRATGAVCEAESNAGYYIIGWYINGKIYQEGGKNFVGNRLVLSVADSQSANVYVCFGTSASASPTYAYNEIRSTAVNASIGGEALLVAGDLNSMANDDTLNFAANIVASGYEFLGWFANDRLLTTDMSCRLNRATIQGFILEARFAPIDDSNINWDLNN